MSPDVKLSICIPTYNRPDKLKKVLLQIIPQLTKECELIIRDDSENDNSAVLIEQLTRNQENQIHIFRGPKLGLDLANLFLLEKAKGKFIWWLSDDDQVDSLIISKIIEVIDENKQLTFIWLNFVSAFSNTSAVADKTDGFFKNNGEFFRIVGPSLGLLSCLVLNRNKGLPFLDIAKSKSIGFGFAALIPVFGAISKDDKIYFLQGPFIINHPDTMEEIESRSKTRDLQQGSQAFEIYAVNFPDILTLFEENLDKAAIKHLIGRNFSHFWRGFVIGIAKGYDTIDGKRMDIFRRYWWHPEFVLAFIVMQFPSPVLKLAYRLYKILKIKFS